VRACASRLHAPSHRTAVTGGIYSSARAARCGRACVVSFGATGRARASASAATGITWTSRTTGAPWAARSDHTSVIDAFGAIYVIGGIGRDYPDYTYYRDVWASTDEVPNRTRSKRDCRGVIEGVVKGY
jgi:hypothetical protein